MFLVVVVSLDFVPSEEQHLVLVVLCNDVFTGRNDAQLAKIFGWFAVIIGNG